MTNQCQFTWSVNNVLAWLDVKIPSLEYSVSVWLRFAATDDILRCKRARAATGSADHHFEGVTSKEE